MLRRPPCSPLFPYTTLFRSHRPHRVAIPAHRERTPASRSRLSPDRAADRKSTRLNSSHLGISYAVFCLKKKKDNRTHDTLSRQNRLLRARAKIRATVKARMM